MLLVVFDGCLLFLQKMINVDGFLFVFSGSLDVFACFLMVFNCFRIVLPDLLSL